MKVDAVPLLLDPGCLLCKIRDDVLGSQLSERITIPSFQPATHLPDRHSRPPQARLESSTAVWRHSWIPDLLRNSGMTGENELRKIRGDEAKLLSRREQGPK